MHPYSNLPDKHFWKRAISNKPWTTIDFFTTAKFEISAGARIATAGSCFAANISRHLEKRGGGIFVAEESHPLLPPELAAQMGYGHFSARYGNVYTVRQMLEIVLQATGQMDQVMDISESGGAAFDLLRPAIQPGGFSSRAEAMADRAFHLSRVESLFRTADVFVFTLGLTEAWQHISGYTYPMCPGTAAGTYDTSIHKFMNFSCADILADLRRLISQIHGLNPAMKIILTVSPVHLVATQTDTNVLVASTYSKSALRAACEEVARDSDFVEYFPAYEIVLSAASFGQYLEPDLRDISEKGIAHVMEVFFAAFFGDAAPSRIEAPGKSARSVDLAARILQQECDELMNDPDLSARTT